MTIWRNLANALVVPEIRNRILFVFGAFALFVIMVHVQIPYVDIAKWQNILNQGQFLNFLGFLSGGALQRFSVLAMGITPYINASIIMQLFTVVFPEIKELMQHGGGDHQVVVLAGKLDLPNVLLESVDLGRGFCRQSHLGPLEHGAAQVDERYFQIGQLFQKFERIVPRSAADVEHIDRVR